MFVDGPTANFHFSSLPQGYMIPMKNIRDVKLWYERNYKSEGPAAQRNYPNEELLRFMGRNYFALSSTERRKTKILEVGCGSGANLWMLAREGFAATGLDLSGEALKHARLRLGGWQTEAALIEGSMTLLPFELCQFDVIVDVFSSNCLTRTLYLEFLREVRRVLKPNGILFSYTPSAKSGAYIDFAPAKKIDEYTLEGILRNDSPFYGNFYPFRFEDPAELKKLLISHGFEVKYLETVRRSYRHQSEDFEHIVFEAAKPPGS